LDADICTVDILDTAHLYYSTMFDYYVRTGQGFIIVFSVTDKNSFDAVSVYHEMLLRSQEDEEEEV
jgi:GTPase KRas protein